MTAMQHHEKMREQLARVMAYTMIAAKLPTPPRIGAGER
jgi:hypothetical protein